MRLLTLVTFIWAFSFSLIGVYLAGKIDSYFAVLIRVVLASFIFLPFTNFKLANKFKLQIMGIGIIQVGLMYIFFYKSFMFLTVPEVLLFTIFTPIYITIIYDLLKGKFNPLYILTAAIAVLGAYVIKSSQINDGFFVGFMMVQGANICFALGQVLYKRLLENDELKDIKQSTIFGYFHYGALIVSLMAFVFFGNMERITPDITQWAVLIWLGIVASGLGYFLWNRGATQVDSGILAIMNNAVVPLGLIVNLLLWGKDIDYVSLVFGGGLILLALWLHKQVMKRSSPQVAL
ncbi:MAG: EamA family transporter [Sulfurovum sp.]|nr:EamA family transporter [Sulfurovum sp.]